MILGGCFYLFCWQFIVVIYSLFKEFCVKSTFCSMTCGNWKPSLVAYSIMVYTQCCARIFALAMFFDHLCHSLEKCYVHLGTMLFFKYSFSCGNGLRHLHEWEKHQSSNASKCRPELAGFRQVWFFVYICWYGIGNIVFGTYSDGLINVVK